MAIPDWALIAISLVATLSLCFVAGFLVRRSAWPAVTACVVSGFVTTPAVVFLWFKTAGSIVGSHNSRIWFLGAWVLCIGMSLAFARAYRKRARSA